MCRRHQLYKLQLYTLLTVCVRHTLKFTWIFAVKTVIRDRRGNLHPRHNLRLWLVILSV